MIEGSLPVNANVFVVDDMVTTGGSILQAAEYVHAEGVKSVIMTSISRHNLKKTNAALEAKNVVLKSLFNTTDLFDIAYAKGFITGREMKMIMEWLTQLDE